MAESLSDLLMKARLAFNDNRFVLSVELYTQAIDLNPNNAELFVDRAQANIKLANFKEAVADANKAIQLDPSMAKAYLRKATACIKLKEYQTAKVALETGSSLARGDSRFTKLIEKCDQRIADMLWLTEENSTAIVQKASTAPAVSSPRASNSTTVPSATQAKPKISYEFYQKPEEVVVHILAKGITAKNVSIDYGEQIMSATIDLPGQEPYMLQIRLFGKIVPSKCRYEVLSTKIEIRLAKAEPIHWTSLEFVKENIVTQRINVSSGAHKPVYPSSKLAAVDWDKLEAELKQEEKNEKLDGDAALNKFFRDIYSDNDDTRRAMSKSFVESDGTVLSTNWKEVGAKKVEGSPWDGMEVKKWTNWKEVGAKKVEGSPWDGMEVKKWNIERGTFVTKGKIDQKEGVQSVVNVHHPSVKIEVNDNLVKQLQRKRNSVMQLMNEAEEKQFTESYIREWLMSIKHTMYNANTLLDKIDTEARFRENYKEDGSSDEGFVRWATSEINRIIEELEGMVKKAANMGLKARDEGAAASASQTQVRNDRVTSPVLSKSTIVYGREEEKARILKQVLYSPEPAAPGNKPKVIVIVGMDGLGKTALAQYVYNHAEVSRRFVRSWVCIPYGYPYVNLKQAILESLGQRASSLSPLSELKKRLEEELRGKRFLVVLDDVWVKYRYDWEELMALFSSGVQGSKIIVTARDHMVASVVSSGYVVELKPMSVEDGWSLFSSKVFPDGDLSRHSKLEAIGKKIVLKCHGLPLAIEVLGGLLRFHQDEKLWENVLESSLWEIPFYDKHDKPYLVMSYSFLPSHLKRCFAYCSLFPHHYVFSGEELVNLWIDEGFVQRTNDGRSMEDVGQSFLEELTSRSLFIKDKYGSGYTMHDLVHNLAQRVSEDFHERVDWASPRFRDTDRRKIHHVSFQDSIRCSGYIDEQRLAQLTPESLQTFMTFHASPSHLRWGVNDTMLEAILLKQHSLRVLCLRGTSIRTLPDTISNLKLLRYLDVSYTDVKQLSASLFSLYSLRRLQCVGCDRLEAFDTKMARLVSLRHFTLEGKRLHKAPRHLWQLKECSVKAVFYLPYHVQKGQVNVDKANPDDGVHLLRVSINMGKSAFSYSVPDCGLFARADHSVLLESLGPHRDLQEVSIQFFNGTGFPAWLVSRSYHNIASVELKHCQISCGSLPALGRLPSLRYLILEDVGHMKTLGLEFYGCNDPFLSLEELSFEDMKEWEVWRPDGAAGICFFPRLAKLYLLNCPRLKSRLPAQLPALKELVLRGCHSLVDYCLYDNNFFVFSSLGSLVLEGCDLPGSFPVKGSLSTSLTSLRIKSFTTWKKLDVIGLQSLVFLEELKIDDCPMLETLPGESLALSSDEDEGSVDHFPVSEALPEESLPLSSDVDENFPVDNEFLLSSLTTLSIKNCVNLKTLDGVWLRSLTSLHELLISSCRKLESLPEEGLRSSLTLKKLCIYSCPMLEALPEEGLPRSLEVLRLCWNHPKLRERCRRDIGPDWPKIAHVPEIRIL